METEGGREAARKEVNKDGVCAEDMSIAVAPASLPLTPFPQLGALQRKLSETESDFGLREKELLGSLEEARGNEKKLQDNTRNLEIKALASAEDVAQLGLKLSASEGRVHGLEAELARLEGVKREMEFKLSSLHSALRRTLGIGRTGRTPSPAIRGRSSSPKRVFSPLKGSS